MEEVIEEVRVAVKDCVPEEVAETVEDGKGEGVEEAERVGKKQANKEDELVALVMKPAGHVVQTEKAVPFANVFSGHTAQDVLPCPD